MQEKSSFENIIVGSWSGLTFAHKLLVLSILAAKLDFFAYGSFNVFCSWDSKTDRVKISKFSD